MSPKGVQRNTKVCDWDRVYLKCHYAVETQRDKQFHGGEFYECLGPSVRDRQHRKNSEERKYRLTWQK